MTKGNNIVFIDEYGWIVPESKSKYKVTLSGSYSWSNHANAWYYDVEKTEPKIPLSQIICDRFLINK